MEVLKEEYKKLSQREHILLRPETYIGPVVPTTEIANVYDAESGMIVQREVTFVPGLMKIFDEILVNAADNKQRDPSMNKLTVDIHPDGPRPSIVVYNNGAGIPVEPSAHDPSVMTPELIFGHLLTSSNYNDDIKKTTGGRNGYGAKLTNIFSQEFIVETSDGSRTGKKYHQTFTCNMGEISKPKVSASTKKGGGDWTRITMYPDMSKFGYEPCSGFDIDTVDLFRRRVNDIAGTVPGIKVTLDGTVVPCRSFKDYVGLCSTSAVFDTFGGRWQVAVAASDGAFRQISFVNSIATTRGGTHVAHVTDQVVAWFVDRLHRTQKMSLKTNQVKQQLCVFVNALIENPAFDSQTKETLTTRSSAFGSRCELTDAFLKRVEKGTGVSEMAAALVKSREQKQLTATDGRKKSRITGIPKLEDANFAGTAKSGECTLILTEGDSAKALAVSGFSVVGRDKYGVFPLRGKLINPREAKHDQIMKNEEIKALKTILGLQQGHAYTDIKSLRYGHIMIMTDQDPDGSHIKGLVINFLHYFWPSLLKIPGFIVEFVTPIVKVRRRKQCRTFFTLHEYKTWCAKTEAKEAGWTIKYYKGLGTSTGAEAREYFSDLKTHQLDFVYDGQPIVDDLIDMAFSKRRADNRKEWINASDKDAFVDHSQSTLTYSDFVNRELVHFSVMDNVRSIPSMLDGFKPGQRKILFSCFKRKLREEIKVAQLAGYVAEHSSYHHGEVSLAGTIVGMAQTFVGSNNLNLLFPSGQFGTRLQGGKDAASTRYIFTRLTPSARALFPEEDDILLDFLKDDGNDIEPRYYIPILPMVLVNGSDGIGTGWSSSVPMHDPRRIVEALRWRIRQQQGVPPLTPLVPWFRGFRGTIERDGSSNSFIARGVGHLIGENVLEISELPPRTWTQTYKEWLEAQSEGDRAMVVRFDEHHTEAHVRFTVTLTELGTRRAAEEGGIEKHFKLDTKISMSNMHLFDENGSIARYESAEAIIDAFFPIRLDGYVRRKISILSALVTKAANLEDRVRFILEVVHGSIVISKRKLNDIEHELEEKGYNKKEGGYGHLLGERLSALTEEKVRALSAELAATHAERSALEAKSPEDLWEADLDRLIALFERDIAADDEEDGQGPPHKVGKGKKRASDAHEGATKKIKNN